MYIPVTNDGQPFYSQGFVVRLYKSDGSNWVANFQLGLGGHSGVYELQEKSKFVIFAGGNCYIMTPDSTKPLDRFGVAFQQVFISNQKELIVIDLTDITVIEPNGQHWDSERISWDGFKDLKLSESTISGLSFDPMDRKNEWIPFTFNIQTREITGGSYRRYEFTPIGKNVERVKRKDETPWWKFWN